MTSTHIEERPPVAFEMLSEPVVVADTFVTGMVDPETVDVGDTLRLTFFVKRRSPYGGDDYTVESRLVMPSHVAWAMAKAILRHFGIQCVGAACAFAKRHMN